MRSHDVLSSATAPQREALARAVSQVCLASTASTAWPVVQNREIDFWATICRKILQRGRRPPVSSRVEHIIGERSGGQAAPPDALVAAAWGRTAPFALADSYELDRQWEVPFWEAATRLHPAAAAWLVPQAPLEALVGDRTLTRDARRWVDFLFCPPGRPPVVLEIDGAGHERRKEVDTARDRLLRSVGISVDRDSGVAAIDPAGRFLSLLGGAGPRTDPAEDALIALHGPAVAARLGVAVIEAVTRGFLPKGGPWSLEVEDDLGLIDEVAGSALDLLRAISEVWSLGVVPPVVRLNDRLWHLVGSDAGHDDGRATRPTVRVRLQAFTPFYAQLPESADIPEVVVRRVGVPARLGWMAQGSRERRTIPRAAEIDVHLRLLLADLFGHDDFRDGQLSSIRQVLAGGDAVVLLPTGSGKSLIYQLAGLMSPGATLVVDPLISLIDDQERHLTHDGVDRVAALHSGKPDAAEALLAMVAAGDVHFAFVTPERLQSRRFRDHLRETAREQSVNLAVVDEAHCVSEWGHDFRTSYLRLARNIRRLCRDQDGKIPPLLALTGTASPAVLRDVLRELEIDPEADGTLQRPKSHDRPNLTYRNVVGTEAEWFALVIDAITELVPNHLKSSVEDLAMMRGLHTLSGIIFSPHAGGSHGIETIRDRVVDEFASRGIPLEAVVYSGQSPVDGAEAGWARRKAEAANQFKDNEVSLLVGTKAFGMGIDKPNIRYTIHAGFPSSIEAFAQEAGRAGRNGEPAICVLTAAMPQAEVAKRLLDRDLLPERRTLLANATRGALGGDLRRQLYFLGNSFPGQSEEVDLTTRLYGWLLRKGGRPRAEVVISLRPRPDPHRRQPGEYRKRDEDRKREEYRKRVDRALYRLSMIGVVDDVTIDGPEATVYFVDYDADGIDAAFLGFASRVDPGKEIAHRASVGDAPPDIDQRVEHHVKALVGIVYRIVERARLMALETMFGLASLPDDPELIRATINAYLGEGPAATMLSEAVAITPVDLLRFVSALEALPVEDVVELSGATARQLEAYPDHPLLWLSSALATARTADGEAGQFKASFERALRQLVDYQVDGQEAAAAVKWLVGRLRNENHGRRWDWVAAVYRAWDTVPFADDLLQSLEEETLDLARRGAFHPGELEVVAWRRLRRRAAAVDTWADDFATATPGSPDKE